MKAGDWTAEKLGALDTKPLRELRANAERLNANDLVERCDAELTRRAPAPKQRNANPQQRNSIEYVAEYHFVCERDRGVVFEPDGTFWTGSWVVASYEVSRSIKHGAHVALHESKAEPSYRQGRLVGSRPMPRTMIKKTNTGLALRVMPTDSSLIWAGNGAGEKGYRWAKPGTESGEGSGA